jgi:hypothetical protein
MAAVPGASPGRGHHRADRRGGPRTGLLTRPGETMTPADAGEGPAGHGARREEAESVPAILIVLIPSFFETAVAGRS